MMSTQQEEVGIGWTKCPVRGGFWCRLGRTRRCNAPGPDVRVDEPGATVKSGEGTTVAFRASACGVKGRNLATCRKSKS
jgi:hypothetical protein